MANNNNNNNNTPEQWAAMTKLVQLFFQKPDAEPFREEVNWKMLGLHDYPTMIKTPMDLGTIKKKITAQVYPTIFACHEDVQLVWNNCMTYNQDGSDFYLLAQTLSKKWNERFQKLISDFGLGQDKNLSQPSSHTMMVSLEEKRAFAKLLYKLTKEELGTILVNLDHKCPAAIIKNVTEDEVELNVDQITPVMFTELMKYANECVTTRAHSKNKTSTTATTGNGSQTTMAKTGVKKQKLG